MSRIRIPLLARDPVSLIGMAIATAMAIIFLILLILELFGALTNPYLGLVVFVAVPLVFVGGLLLIPLGAWRAARRRRLRPDADDWPVIDLRIPRQRTTLLVVFVLTVINMVIVSLGAYGGIHYMESAAFCGRVCHTTMEPEAVSHLAWPHASVSCTACHVGAGAGAFVEAKLAGARQLLHVATNRVPKPVPPPAELIQSSEFTCERCHSARMRSGDRLRQIRDYANDEKNSETVTTLRLHVGDRASGIHRHIGLDIEYIASDEARTTIPVVRVRTAGGAVREFRAEGAEAATKSGAVARRMDCTDCHNRPAHTFSFSPERAVDQAISRGAIPRNLAFVRREAVAAMAVKADSRPAGSQAVAEHLRAFYASRPDTDRALLDRAIAGAQETWMRNIFPDMRVKWGTYPSHLGHIDSPGCFRCHDDRKAADGSTIKQECDLCHTIPE